MKYKEKFMVLFIFVIIVLSLSFAFFYSLSYPENINIISELKDRNIFHKLEGFKTINLFHRVLVIPKYVKVINSYVDYEKDETRKFANLIEKLKNIPYIEQPTENIYDGANCQTMTIYIQDWCERNNIVYKIQIEPTHVYLLVRINTVWKIVNFNRRLQVYDEYIR